MLKFSKNLAGPYPPCPYLPTYLPIPYLWETKKEILGPPCTTLGTGLRGGMKVAARIGEGLRREIERGRRPRVRVGDG